MEGIRLSDNSDYLVVSPRKCFSFFNLRLCTDHSSENLGPAKFPSESCRRPFQKENFLRSVGQAKNPWGFVAIKSNSRNCCLFRILLRDWQYLCQLDPQILSLFHTCRVFSTDLVFSFSCASDEFNSTYSINSRCFSILLLLQSDISIMTLFLYFSWKYNIAKQSNLME
jgi:hypothetical protein